jgi:uncharacterized membrane protein
MEFTDTVESIGKIVEVAGVAIIVIGMVAATITAVTRLLGEMQVHDWYRDFRRSVGRSILLGLEFLVAGDIIRTVAIDPTFESVGVLAIIVAIRTFLSLELELEIDGRWPWERKDDQETADNR